MRELLDRKLVIVAGKGGVGKTTTACAVALELAARGRKTMLVTVDPAKRLEDALGVPVGFRATSVQPNLWAMMLDPGTVIKDHLEARVPNANLTAHPLFKQVTGALPGLNELMAIGKLNDLRKAGTYDVIVVDTAPTGHALSFLGAPKMVREVLRDGSLLRWAVRGYAVWQRVTGTARSVTNVFKGKEERRESPPDIDFERIFTDMQAEAEAIQAFLGDPGHSALVVVTLPEKLPVEETVDLHDTVVDELGMKVRLVVVNRVQPDALGAAAAEVAGLDEAGRARLAQGLAASSGHSVAFALGLVEAARFHELRRQLNVGFVAELSRRLPDVAMVQVPLLAEDPQGLRRLGELRRELFR